MSLRRGFVKEANEISDSIRRELGLAASAPLNPWRVAEHLDIPVLGMRSFTDDAPSAVFHFSGSGQSAFSGATVFYELSRIIVHNDSHSIGRQANDVSHELSHALLLHDPSPALDDLGCRFWDQNIEDEATRLGGTLLVPLDAALLIARKGISAEQAATEYGVSTKLMNFRLNITNAHVIAGRGKRVRR